MSLINRLFSDRVYFYTYFIQVNGTFLSHLSGIVHFESIVYVITALTALRANAIHNQLVVRVDLAVSLVYITLFDKTTPSNKNNYIRSYLK